MAQVVQLCLAAVAQKYKVELLGFDNGSKGWWFYRENIGKHGKTWGKHGELMETKTRFHQIWYEQIIDPVLISSWS